MRFKASNLIIFIMVIFFLIAGCGVQNSPAKKQRQLVSHEEIVINHEIAEAAKQRAGVVKGVRKVTAVAINKELSVAIKVSGFERLRLKSIREQVHDTVKEINGDYNVYVTSDKKLFMRLQQIEQQTEQAQGQSSADIGSEFKAINKDM
ncbi:MAG: YhcN/YlaJ family sporulation lipoprotein [Desulfotomaculaceae bacterium]|nr:YhcN/YlaJ family sporulation lipoprotein [Desulfotomaculaceae bacterium]